MLFKYDVLLRSETSNNVFRVLQANNFEEGIDYLLKKERVDGGRTEKKIYMLSSDAITTVVFFKNNFLLQQHYEMFRFLMLFKKIFFTV